MRDRVTLRRMAWFLVFGFVILHPLRSLAAACEAVRPGARIHIGSHGCTMNFLFRGDDGHRYVGTAGHCVIDDESIERWKGTRGPQATLDNGSTIGSVAYAAYQLEPYEGKLDFALIRLAPGVPIDPSMCGWGGPRGINTGKSDDVVEVRWYGQGDVMGTVSPQRSGTALGMPDDHHFYFNGPAITGDSGAALIDAEGRAIGLIVTVGLHTWARESPHVATDGHAGSAGVLRLMPQLDRAETELGTQLRLVGS